LAPTAEGAIWIKPIITSLKRVQSLFDASAKITELQKLSLRAFRSAMSAKSTETIADNTPKQKFPLAYHSTLNSALSSYYAVGSLYLGDSLRRVTGNPRMGSRCHLMCSKTREGSDSTFL
jgi:hypothetical protein